jgi:hypothetical protein
MGQLSPYLAIWRQRQEVAMHPTKEVRLVVRQMQVLLKEAQVEGTVVELVALLRIAGGGEKLAGVRGIVELLRLIDRKPARLARTLNSENTRRAVGTSSRGGSRGGGLGLGRVAGPCGFGLAKPPPPPLHSLALRLSG